MTCKLELEELTKAYRGKTALDHFSYAFTGGIYGLLGPNGAGKSTLMNIITQNIRSDQGTIRWNGETIGKKKWEYVSHIGYMPQQQSVYENLTLNRFMYYIAALKGQKKNEADREIERLLKRLDLWEVRRRYLGSFSGGMKQRALLAQALLGDPDLIILDEPTAGLDPLQRIEVRELIRELDKNRIILISTHVLSDIEPIADEILMLKKGKLLKDCSLKLDEQKGETLEEMYVRLFG